MKTIDEQKAEQKFIMQFIRKETGARTEPFTTSFDKLYEVLSEQEERNDEDYILLVAILDGENTRIPPTPLITVETFVNNYTLQPFEKEASQ